MKLRPVSVQWIRGYHQLNSQLITRHFISITWFGFMNTVCYLEKDQSQKNAFENILSMSPTTSSMGADQI